MGVTVQYVLNTKKSRNVSLLAQKESFLIKYNSEHVLTYFYLSEVVESVLLLLPEYANTSMHTVTSVQNGSSFATTALQSQASNRNAVQL